MGRTTEALGPAPTAAVEGPTADGLTAEDGPAAEDRPAAATLAAGDPAAVEEGPTTGEDGPWSTRDL